MYSKGPYQFWRLGTFVLFGIMVGSLLMSGILIYNYTFRALEDAHTIVLLNSDAAVDKVNLDNYNKATGLISLKTVATPIPANLRNIFVYLSTSTPSTSYANTQ